MAIAMTVFVVALAAAAVAACLIYILGPTSIADHCTSRPISSETYQKYSFDSHFGSTDAAVMAGGDVIQTGGIVFYFGVIVEVAVWSVTGLCLPKFYAVAVVWTPNSREEIRARSVAVNEFVELQTTAGGMSVLARASIPGSQSIGWQPHNCETFKPSPETSVSEVISVQ
ncbi:hypothetical protein C8R45DRAFT_939687 [Mycena sanguinolenta]|nr:hypothetical protein C8R45DRAFT_939687 [Mycena sanguinolenta]